MTETIKKQSMATLIRGFFKLPGEDLKDFTHQYQQLTDTDKAQLASAIARNNGLSQAECSFPLVEY